jgi:tetratricopeptide (TPR) repeat protein
MLRKLPSAGRLERIFAQVQGWPRPMLFRAANILKSANRLMFAGMILMGFAALACSVRRTWFEVPVGPIFGARSPQDIVALTPECNVVFQGIMAAGAICLLASWISRRQWTMLSTVIATLLCVVPLAYPYFVMLRSPVAAAEATWLQMQYDNLLWLGGDIHNNAEFAQLGWKSKTYMIDLPRQLSVVELPEWTAWEIGLDRTEDLVHWLGYSNAFCNFVKSGWSLAVIGSFLLLLSSLQRSGQFVFHRAGVAIVVLTLTLVTSVFAGWSLPFRASGHVNRAAALCSQCRYGESLAELQHAVELLPVLGQDTYYVAQRGVLEKKLGRDTEYVQMRDAIRWEADGRYDQAYSILESLTQSADPAIRREALRGIARHAIQDFNSGRFELSNERLRLVLAQQPCNLKLIYLLQIQAIRENRPQTVYAMCEWMQEATARMAFATKKVARAAANQHAVLAAGLEGDPWKTAAAQCKARRP